MSLLEHTPALTPDRAQDIARTVYGIAATAHPLPSERDQNFRLDVDGTPTYVLKVANRTESLEALAAQHGAAVRARAAGLPVQRLHRSVDGGDTAIVEGHVVRLLDWLPGVPLAQVQAPSDAMLDDLGRLLGRHSRAMEGYDHPGAHRDFHWDVARAVQVLGERRDRGHRYRRPRSRRRRAGRAAPARRAGAAAAPHRCRARRRQRPQRARRRRRPVPPR